MADSEHGTGRSSVLYVLDDDNNLVPADDIVHWAKWMSVESHTGRLQIGDDTIGGVRISTVFTGEERPFETMIWGGLMDKQKWFYASYDDALAGHAEIIERYFPVRDE